MAFEIAQPQLVAVSISDVLGKRVRAFSVRCEAGSQKLHWDGMSDDGSTLPNGTYFYRVLADGQVITGKLALSKQR
jgi:flagellar hook assembly protein FlgD